MDKLQKVVVDCSTGIAEYIDLTDEEMAEVKQREANAEAYYAAQETAAKAKAEAKASAEAKLAALGLTAEEIAAL